MAFRGYPVIVSSGDSSSVPAFGYKLNDGAAIAGYAGAVAPPAENAGGTLYAFRSYPAGVYRGFPTFAARSYPRA